MYSAPGRGSQGGVRAAFSERRQEHAQREYRGQGEKELKLGASPVEGRELPGQLLSLPGQHF